MIDKELAAFLQEGIAIQIGTRNARLEPNGARVVAIKVEDDGQHVVAHRAEGSGAAGGAGSRVKRTSCTRVRASARRASVSGERRVRRGARRACVRAIVRVRAVGTVWVRQLGSIGFPPAATENWQTWPCVAIRLRVTALFNQTPGPGAGAALP